MPKKKSSTQKGNETVDEYIRDFLEPTGWISAKAGRQTRFGNEDLFGQFDILSLRKGEILLTQVKTNQSSWEAKKIRDWADKHNDYLPENLSIQYVNKKKATKTLPVRWEIIDI